jgi:hypothetical protein
MLSRGPGYRIRERFFNRANRILLPHMADSIRGEASDDKFAGDDESGAPQHIHIVDRGSDATIISFSSAAMLHAGQPTREFEGFFARHGERYNLVFLRDIHRSAYHFTPLSEPHGLEFHEAELKRTLAALGSKRVIAIGDSSGAAAAIYFGVRLGFDQIIAFSPPFPLKYWIRPSAQLHAYFNLPLLFREPSGYWEHVLLSLTVPFFFYIPIGRRCGFANIFNPIADYCAAAKRPLLTVFYGEDSRPEANIVAPLRQFPEVTIRPLPTAKHFCMGALARTGRLGSTIMGIIDGADRAAAVTEASKQ